MLMKKIFAIIVLALVCASCKEDNLPTLPEFEVDRTTIEAQAEGGSFELNIRSSEEWRASTTEPWVMISPANGRGEVVARVRIDSSLTNDNRSTLIRFTTAENSNRTIEVMQSGFAKAITPLSDTEEIASFAKRDDRWFETEIETNVDFDVITQFDEEEEEWLTVADYNVELNRGARPRITTLRCNWKMNTRNSERLATLRLRAKEGGAEATIIVRQGAAPTITDDRAGDSLAVVTIYEKLECWAEDTIDAKKPMTSWECLRLWSADDESLPSPEAVGRVRDLDLSYFNTEEGIPYEIKYLKYLETLSLFGNVNTMLKSIDMGEEICELEYLKALRVGAFGLSSLPKNFAKLGDTLEILDLNSNNFDRLPAVISEDNFPKLTSLNLTANRRKSTNDLRGTTEGIGLYSDMNSSDDIERLLLWENLEELGLSFNYIEGSLPDFKVGENGVRAYTAEDVKEAGDTLNWAVEHQLPRILPNMHSLRINLNFMTGELPRWLLYHPRLMEWGANILVFEQQSPATDSRGLSVKFDNVPNSMEYYFESYPLYRGRYEFKDEIGE